MNIFNWIRLVASGIILVFYFSSQSIIAQTTAVSPAASANAAVAKGLEYWQYASNGQKFEELAVLSSEEMGKLPFAIRIEIKKWKQSQLDQAAIRRQKEEWQLDQAAIEDSIRIDWKKQAAIVQLIEYIWSFQRLHSNIGKPWFNRELYGKMKNELRWILLSGKPSEILPQLEPLRAILMSADDPAPRK